MANSAKPAGVVVPQGEAREGVVSSIEKRTTKAGGPMLILTIGEERVSFFESADVDQPAAIGDTVKFALTRKGTYLNGKGLAVTSKSASQPQPAQQPQVQPPVQAPPQPQPQPKPKPAPTKLAPGTRPALHDFDVSQLEVLYEQESSQAKVEPARLGQISNQVRYARIEQSLAELQGLLREVLAMLQKSFFNTNE